MSSPTSFGLCLLSLIWATVGLQLNDHLLMFASQGDSITLPCDIPSISSCSSVNWSMGEEFGAFTEVVKAGKVTAAEVHRHVVLKDCSLRITDLILNDARVYSCDSGTLNSTVSLQILKVAEESTAEQDTMELHCYLSNYRGHMYCLNDRGILIKWSTEDDTPINGTRFTFENPSDCFSKLIINKKLTDHHRKWKCQLSQNDVVKATTSYTTTVTDGLEEVFAAAGESVSLSCSHTSSLGGSAGIKWALCEKPLTDDISPDKGQTEAFGVSKDSSLLIGEVSALHAGDYQCSESTGQQRVLNKIRLHTLDVKVESGPGGDNLTFTCVLTCAQECEEDFNLTWSGSTQKGWQSELMSVNNTFIKRLFLPVCSVRSDGVTCSVHREGAVMAIKKWRSVNSLQTLAWLGLPLGLLIGLAAGGLYMYKRKHNKDAANEQSSIRMTHVYEVIEDVNNEELQQQRHLKREAVTTNDSFYDLLQAVN